MAGLGSILAATGDTSTIFGPRVAAGLVAATPGRQIRMDADDRFPSVADVLAGSSSGHFWSNSPTSENPQPPIFRLRFLRFSFGYWPKHRRAEKKTPPLSPLGRGGLSDPRGFCLKLLRFSFRNTGRRSESRSGVARSHLTRLRHLTPGDRLRLKPLMATHRLPGRTRRDRRLPPDAGSPSAAAVEFGRRICRFAEIPNVFWNVEKRPLSGASAPGNSHVFRHVFCVPDTHTSYGNQG
jgi:hypothetical protein